MNRALHKKEKKEILNCISNFSKVVQQNGWISHYDCDSDSFVIREPQLSKNAHKKYINDEFAFYINRAEKVEGVFIEYFTSNFMSHHKGIKPLIKNIKNNNYKDRKEPLVALKKEEIKKFTNRLETVMVDSLIHQPT